MPRVAVGRSWVNGSTHQRIKRQACMVDQACSSITDQSLRGAGGSNARCLLSTQDCMKNRLRANMATQIQPLDIAVTLCDISPSC